MAEILSSYISSIRGTQTSGSAGFISKMKIGDSLYKIKDPSVDDLAAYIESHYKVLDAEQISNDASKYISGVSLDANGKINFNQTDLPTHATFTKAANTYIAAVNKDASGNITFTSGIFPVTGVTASAATANTYVASISLSNGKVTATRGTFPTHATFTKKANTYIAAVNVDSNGNVTFGEGTLPTIPSILISSSADTNTFDKAYVSIVKGSGSHTITTKTGFLSTTGVKSTSAVGDAAANSTLNTVLSKIIGTTNDAETAKSIAGAKKYAYNLVNALSENGVAGAVEQINHIIEELKEDGNSSYLVTIVDRLRDVKDTHGNFMDVGAYVTSKITNMVTAAAELTENKIVLGNGAKTVKKSDYSISSDSQLTPLQTKIIPTASAVTNYTQGIINDLDNTVRDNLNASDVLDSGHAIGAKVVQTDGKLTSITVVENFKANGMSYVSYANEQIEFALSYMVVKK